MVIGNGESLLKKEAFRVPEMGSNVQ